MLWQIKFDPRGDPRNKKTYDPEYGCKHVNVLSGGESHLPEEEEFLFVPYSVFRVKSCTWVRAAFIRLWHASRIPPTHSVPPPNTPRAHPLSQFDSSGRAGKTERGAPSHYARSSS